MRELILPTYPELVKGIDAALMWEIEHEVTGVARALYDFFDSPRKPIDPREFMHYWLALTEEEKLLIMLFPELLES